MKVILRRREEEVITKTNRKRRIRVRMLFRKNYCKITLIEGVGEGKEEGRETGEEAGVYEEGGVGGEAGRV